MFMDCISCNAIEIKFIETAAIFSVVSINDIQQDSPDNGLW